MRVVVFGHRGQLGRALTKRIRFDHPNYIVADFGSTDITNASEVLGFLKAQSPDIVINAAAFTDVEGAESEFSLAFDVNSRGVQILARACLSVRAFLIHISTDYVFDGSSKRKYLENDKPNPINNYGKSKYLGELNIINSGVNYLILRTSWVFSEHGGNFLRSIIDKSLAKLPIKVVNDQIGTPTYAHDLAEAISRTLPYLLNKSQLKGIFHYAGLPATSWYNFAEYILMKAYEHRVISEPAVIHPIATSDLKSLLCRPAHSGLDSSKFELQFGCKPSNWQGGVEAVIKMLVSQDLKG